jgi:hypothetical protein
MIWTQLHGFQGHKRLNRYESCKDRAHYIKMQNYCIDMFGESVEPSWNYSVAAPVDLHGYLDAYLAWEDSVYQNLSAIALDLDNMGFPCEAALVREGLPGKEIERVRRMITEYGISGWDMSYILLQDAKLHKKMKKKEKAGR